MKRRPRPEMGWSAIQEEEEEEEYIYPVMNGTRTANCVATSFT
jgi:hypothetical protein